MEETPKKKGRLTIDEREAIAKGLAEGKTFTAIALSIGRAISTVSNEVNKNTREDACGWAYSPTVSQQRAVEKARTTHRRPLKLQFNTAVAQKVREKLLKRWSPRQAAEAVNSDPGIDGTISHETIYQYIYVFAVGSLKKELQACLRRKRPKRKKRGGPPEKRGQIPGMVKISERPPEVAERVLPGHWEGDLIVGKDHKSAVLTLVERTTRFLLMARLPDCRAETVNQAMKRLVKKLPQHLKLSITYDRGKEISNHQQFTIDTGISVFICDPHSPWQRGTNENTNGLIRDFFPKGTDFREVSYQKLSYVQGLLNTRIRKTLGWKTPQFALNSLLNNPNSYPDFSLAS